MSAAYGYVADASQAGRCGGAHSAPIPQPHIGAIS